MKKSKLFQLLKKLNKNEFSELGKFIHSPFFNSSKKITLLYNYIANDYPDFQSNNLSKQAAAKNIFPNIIVTDKRVGNLMSDMYYLVIDFLGQMEFQTNKIEKGKLRAEALRKKEMLVEYHKEMETIADELHNLPDRNIDFYATLLHLESRRYASELQIQHGQSKLILESMVDYLDKFYALGKLKFACEMLSRKQILSERYGDILYLENTKKIVEMDFGIENPLFKIYYYIIQLLETNESTHFWKLKELFFAQYELLGEESRLDVLIYMMNFTSRRKVEGNMEFTEEAFEIAKFGYMKGILHEELENTQNTFQNMVIAGVKLGHFLWLEGFIKKIEKNPNSVYSEDILTFAKVIIYYEKKELSKARTLILSHTFKREHDKIRIKGMLIRILYEEYCIDESHYEVLTSTIQAFRKYLKRNKKLPIKRVTPFLNFLSNVRLLIRYRFNRRKSQERKEQLKNKLSPQQTISFDWILSKIDDL